jgi:hypothetical protein
MITKEKDGTEDHFRSSEKETKRKETKSRYGKVRVIENTSILVIEAKAKSSEVTKRPEFV